MSKIIQLLIRELGFTLSLVERQLNDNNDSNDISTLISYRSYRSIVRIVTQYE